MGRRVSGARPLAYLGVWPVTPPNMVIPGIQPTSQPRDPTQSDINHNLGDQWLNKTNRSLWYLAALGSHQVSGVNTRFATWLKFSTGNDELQTLTGNTGGPVGPDANQNINTIADPASGMVVNGVPGTFTLTWTSSGGGHFGETLTGDSGGAVQFDTAGNIDVIAGNATKNAGSTVSIVGNPGTNTLTLNVTSDSNTIIGFNSGNLASAGATENIGLGTSVLTAFTGIAAHNVAIGNNSLANLTTGRANTCIGQMTGGAITTGDSNVAIGFTALMAITTGTDNVALGNGSLSNLTLGASENTAIGDDALNSITTGQRNTALGNSAGFSLTTSDSDNIMISNLGTVGDNNTLRIGAGAGTGAQQLNRAFIHGIRGITTGVNDAIAVLIDSAGQLGTVSSSERFKEDINDMGDYSADLMHLRPVTFNYKNRSSERKSVGLIAEEVMDIMPDLVVFDVDGLPETIRYNDLVPMMLNEMQKMHLRIKELEVQLRADE